MYFVRIVVFVLLSSVKAWGDTGKRTASVKSENQLDATRISMKLYRINDQETFYCCGPRGAHIQWYQVYANNHTLIKSEMDANILCKASGYIGRKVVKTISPLDHNTYLYCISWDKEQTNPRTAHIYHRTDVIRIREEREYPVKFRTYVTIKPTSGRFEVGAVVNYTCEVHSPGMVNDEDYHVDLYQENGNVLTAYETNEEHCYMKIISERDNNSKIYCVASWNNPTFISSTKIDLIVENSSPVNTEYHHDNGVYTRLIFLILPSILICLIIAVLLFYWRRRRLLTQSTLLLENRNEAVTYAELYALPAAANNTEIKRDETPYAEIVGFIKPKENVCQSLRK